MKERHAPDFFPKKKTAGHGTSWRNGDFMIKTEHQETAMKRYFSGEEIEIGDHITTDGGCLLYTSEAADD